jgi:hypothetical protein
MAMLIFGQISGILDLLEVGGRHMVNTPPFVSYIIE